MSQTPSSTTRQRRGLFQLIADIPGLIRELIEAEIAQTVSTPDDLKAELVHLMAVIGKGG